MRSCKVFVHGKEAGLLTENDSAHRYEFTYNREYLESYKDPVSLTMPLREEPYYSDVLFPFFFNMLSEGENRELQASLFHLAKNDDFGILLETAQNDTPGAVTVRPIL